RIGRTARAGATGKAVSLADEAGALQIEPIEKFIGQKIPLGWGEDESFLPEIKPPSEERRRHADEKRARIAAPRAPPGAGGRGGHGPGPRGHGGGQPGGGPRHGRGAR